MATPINPWSSLIYKDHYTGDLSKMTEVALAVCKNISEQHPLEDGGRSTWNRTVNMLELPEFKELKQWLIDNHQQVWNEWGFNDYPRFIHRSWTNWHPPGAKTIEHDHGAVQLVVVVYIKQPIGGGNIQFKDPLQYHWMSHPREDSNNWKTIEVSEGDVLFFPGFLRHRTEENTSNDDRIVLTVNVSAKYVL